MYRIPFMNFKKNTFAPILFFIVITLSSCTSQTIDIEGTTKFSSINTDNNPVQYHTVLPRHAAARPDLARPNPLRNLNSSLDCYKIWKCWALADTRLQTLDHCKCPTQHQTELRSRCNLKDHSEAEATRRE